MQLNELYSKTYNYVYLRAKTLLTKEADVQNLMKEVYMQAAAVEDLSEEAMYEWLGKRTYALGTKFYRKKKAREATAFEFDKNELAGKKSGNEEVTTEVLSNAMEQLPELYQATFYAFFYDYMTISDIAEAMDCTESVIIHRLNYTVKFLKESFVMYNEENGKDAKVVFNLENICHSLRKWSVEHCLGMASAQTLYANICKELKVESGSIYMEGKEFAGVNKRVVYHKADDFAPLYAELEFYAPKEKVNKKKFAIIGGIIAAVVVLAVVLVIAMGGKDSGDKQPVQDAVTDTDVDADVDTDVAVDSDTDATTVPDADTDSDSTTTPDASSDAATDSNTDETEQSVETPSEYMLPKSNTEALTEADLAGMSKAELRLARNEIYARHGMIFGVEDLDEYFGSQSWYEPKYRSDEFYDKVEMSAVEDANVQFILKIEQSM